MGFSYLNDNSWENITREERLFCARLYEYIRKTPLKFVEFLNTKSAENNKPLNLPVDCEWEAGFEVCFYRDLLKSVDKSIKDTDYPDKRTFDLCLFSEKTIVIIEAKAQQGFKSDQVEEFEDDREKIKELLQQIKKEVPDIKIIALASSIYFENFKKHGKIDIGFFDAKISWLDVYQFIGDKIFMRADEIYKDKKK